jgi:hypothetical protein
MPDRLGMAKLPVGGNTDTTSNTGSFYPSHPTPELLPVYLLDIRMTAINVHGRPAALFV